MQPQQRPGAARLIMHTIKRVDPFHFGSLLDKLPGIQQLMRIEFKNPEDDYIYVQPVKNNGTLVLRRKNRLNLAVIRKSHSSLPLEMLRQFVSIQHENIADILNVYFYENQLLIISEYLDVSLFDMDFRQLSAEEWEMATIIQQVKYIYIIEQELTRDR